MPRQRTRSLNVRMTDDEFDYIDRMARRHGLTLSEATRRLVQMGAILESGQHLGFVITPRAQRFLGEGLASVGFMVGLDAEQLDTLQRVTGLPAGERAALEGGAALICTPEDLAGDDEATNFQRWARDNS